MVDTDTVKSSTPSTNSSSITVTFSHSIRVVLLAVYRSVVREKLPKSAVSIQ